MTATNIRVSTQTRDALGELARSAGVSVQEVVDQAIEAYRRERVLNATNAAYAALRADPKAWKEIQEERAAWDATLGDGLEAV